MSVDQTLAQAGSCIRDGQTFERQGTLEGLASAVKSYEAAITLLRALPTESERVRNGLAIALMNRGNALQKQPDPVALDSAVSSYDEAIVLLQTLPLEHSAMDRNTLGAAWMNRGHAQLARNEPASLIESLQSFREAIRVLKTLPLDGAAPFRMNLSAALMNESNALLKSQDPVRALASATAAVAVTTPSEELDPVLADIGLKARRAACEALGQRLFFASQRGEPTQELAEQAIDLVEEALVVARRWESQGHHQFRYIAARLYRFGAQLYAAQHPDFIAEFLLEHVDPARSAGAMAETEEFYLIAAEALTRVRQDLEARRAAFLDTPETNRLLQRFRDLRDAEVRLAELRAHHLGAPTKA